MKEEKSVSREAAGKSFIYNSTDYETNEIGFVSNSRQESPPLPNNLSACDTLQLVPSFSTMQ